MMFLCEIGPELTLLAWYFMCYGLSYGERVLRRRFRLRPVQQVACYLRMVK